MGVYDKKIYVTLSHINLLFTRQPFKSQIDYKYDCGSKM